MSSQLEQELRAVGARPAEAVELASVAGRLPLLKSYKHIKDEAQAPWFGLKPLLVGLTGLAMGIMLILMAQAASPTSWLFPVEKLSDSVAVDVRPQYRANVMMKRAQQVNALVASHASTKKVMATLADYTNQANAYKTVPHANYSAFDYCKANLKQAAAQAQPPVKQAIQSSLKSLESV